MILTGLSNSEALVISFGASGLWIGAILLGSSARSLPRIQRRKRKAASLALLGLSWLLVSLLLASLHAWHSFFAISGAGLIGILVCLYAMSDRANRHMNT